MDQVIPHNGRWFWLGGFASFAIFALSNGKLLLASGFLLLGVFAFFHSPLSPTHSKVAKPSIPVRLSLACGALGIICVLAAAARTLL